MNKEQKAFLKKNGWRFIPKGVAIDTDQFADFDGAEIFFENLNDIDYRKCGFWTDDNERASDDEDEVLEMAGWEEVN